MPKNRKSVNYNEHAIRTEPKFFGKKADLEKISKIVMPPLRMKQSVQSTNQTNDDTTTIIVAETSTKTFIIIIIFFLLLLVLNQKHAANQLQSRDIFSGKVSCHAIELFIDYEHRCLTPCKLHSCSLTEFYVELQICILWLNGTVLPLNTEEDWYLCERSEDSAKNTTEMFIFFSIESFYITQQSTYP